MSYIESDELHAYLSFTLSSGGLSSRSPVIEQSKSTTSGIVTQSEYPAQTNVNLPEASDPAPSTSLEGESGEKYFDPVTGQPISKNAFKRLNKGPTKKEKKEKETSATALAPPAEKKEKKREKRKRA